jgi:hypothetical protein
MNLWPIYVATRGRAGKSPLLAALNKAAGEGKGIRNVMFVESREFLAYREAYPFLPRHDISGNDEGLPYVRNSILEFAERAGVEWFWMLDDDIKGWYQRTGKKLAKAPMEEGLLRAQELAAEGVGQVALEYQQFAWSARKPWVQNSYADCVVGVRTEAAEAVGGFQPPADLKVDRDFTIRLIAGGWAVRRLTTHAFATVKNGTNRGGCHDQYAQRGREEKSSKALAALWPGIVEFNRKRDGRPDAKIKWSKIREIAERGMS